MNHVLSKLEGLDYYLVRRAMRRLLRLHTTADRRALLERIGADDGPEIRALVEQAFREQWEQLLAAQRADGDATEKESCE